MKTYVAGIKTLWQPVPNFLIQAIHEEIGILCEFRSWYN